MTEQKERLKKTIRPRLARRWWRKRASPGYFDQLKERNPKEWEYWMYKCCTDELTGEKYGWARVLDYIGIGY